MQIKPNWIWRPITMTEEGDYEHTTCKGCNKTLPCKKYTLGNGNDIYMCEDCEGVLMDEILKPPEERLL